MCAMMKESRNQDKIADENTLPKGIDLEFDDIDEIGKFELSRPEEVKP